MPILRKKGKRGPIAKIANPLNIHPIRDTVRPVVNMGDAAGNIITQPGNAPQIVLDAGRREISDKKEEIKKVKEVVHDTTIIAKSTVHGAERGYKVGMLFFPTKDGIIISTVVGLAVGLAKGVDEVVKESDEEHKSSSHATENQPHIEGDIIAIYTILEGIEGDEAEGYQIGEYFFPIEKGIEITTDANLSNIALSSEASTGSWNPRLFGTSNNSNNNNAEAADQLAVEDTVMHELSGPS